VCIKRGKAIFSGIVDRDPFCLECLAVGVKVFDVRGQDVRICHSGMKDNWLSWMRQRTNLQDLQFAAQLQICRIKRNEAIQETVWLAGMSIKGTGGAATVFDDNDISSIVRLHPLISTSARNTRNVFDCRLPHVIRRHLPHPSGGAAEFSAKKKMLGKWI